MGRVTPTQPREAGRLTVSGGPQAGRRPEGCGGPPPGVRTRLGETGAWRRSGAALASGSGQSRAEASWRLCCEASAPGASADGGLDRPVAWPGVP